MICTSKFKCVWNMHITFFSNWCCVGLNGESLKYKLSIFFRFNCINQLFSVSDMVFVKIKYFKKLGSNIFLWIKINYLLTIIFNLILKSYVFKFHKQKPRPTVLQANILRLQLFCPSLIVLIHYYESINLFV